ncbi:MULTISPECIES: hypothetical protein [unclassified Methanosarcina]|uniref:hypothetical protein n=1 Tax=unclassified Methanosarcina TaxID=2644672 RepID=UPI000A93FAD1|nr:MULTISPECIES: hypothetical protein [unclassified Methanosarcina]
MNYGFFLLFYSPISDRFFHLRPLLFGIALLELGTRTTEDTIPVALVKFDKATEKWLPVKLSPLPL